MTISSNGRITVPAEIRRLLRLDTGDRVDFVVFDDNRVALMPRNGPVSTLKGLAEWKGLPMSLARV